MGHMFMVCYSGRWRCEVRGRTCGPRLCYSASTSLRWHTALTAVNDTGSQNVVNNFPTRYQPCSSDWLIISHIGTRRQKPKLVSLFGLGAVCDRTPKCLILEKRRRMFGASSYFGASGVFVNQ